MKPIAVDHHFDVEIGLKEFKIDKPIDNSWVFKECTPRIKSGKESTASVPCVGLQQDRTSEKVSEICVVVVL